MKIFCINGAPGAGKTTFEHYVREIMGEDYCYIFSTIDCIKKLALRAGWDGEKTPESRKYLSDLKDLFTKWTDYSFKDVKKKIDVVENSIETLRGFSDDCAVFVDVREPEELQRYKDELGAITVLIHRSAAENVETTNHADENVMNFKYDYKLYNEGNLEDLKGLAKLFIEEFGLYR